MQSFLYQMGLVFAELMSWFDMILATIMSSPILITLCVAIPILQAVVNLFNRLLRL